jgi:hypothetical protein
MLTVCVIGWSDVRLISWYKIRYSGMDHTLLQTLNTMKQLNDTRLFHKILNNGQSTGIRAVKASDACNSPGHLHQHTIHTIYSLMFDGHRRM